MKILILGATGMLGNAVLRYYAKSKDFDVYATVRSQKSVKLLPSNKKHNVKLVVDVENTDTLVRIFSDIRPDIVINCIGIVKQLAEANDVLTTVPVNTMLPHRLARLCEMIGARFVHLSTDCVFSGRKGMYKEADFADAKDLYGRSKFLGEVDYPNSITLRTSIIGHELDGAHGLIGWFLAQKDKVKGYRRAIFSGFPTVEIARIIRDYVIPHPELHGVYHVSADPVNKYDLLTMVAAVYQKNIEIVPDDGLVIDRSLDSTRFRAATGFSPEPWHELVRRMHAFG